MTMEGYSRKIVRAIDPVNAAGATGTAVEIDTLGFAAMDVIAYFGSIDAACTALKLQSTDTTGSGYADVTGADFTAVLPTATDDSKFWVWHVDLRGKKRFFKVILTMGSGTTDNVSVQAELYRNYISPSSASARGAANELTI